MLQLSMSSYALCGCFLVLLSSVCICLPMRLIPVLHVSVLLLFCRTVTSHRWSWRGISIGITTTLVLGHPWKPFCYFFLGAVMVFRYICFKVMFASVCVCVCVCFRWFCIFHVRVPRSVVSWHDRVGFGVWAVPYREFKIFPKEGCSQRSVKWNSKEDPFTRTDYCCCCCWMLLYLYN